MDPKKSFKAFRDDLCHQFPDVEFAAYQSTDAQDFETLITPHVIKVLQKNKSIFDEEFKVFGVNLSPLFPTKPELFWKHIQKCGLASFLGGDIKEKFNSIAESVKNVWGNTHTTDEIEKLLGTEESRSKMSDIFEFIMTTRLARVVTSLAESIDISELGIDFEDPEELMKTFQQENSPVVEKIGRKVKATLEDKVRKGEFTKEMLAADIEAIKLRVQRAFGDMFNDMLGGRKADVPSRVILGNTPEARRARMIARMQRKVEERKTKE